MRQRSCRRWFGISGLLLLLSPVLTGCFAYPVRNSNIVAPGGSGEIADLKRTRKARPATRDLVQKNLGYLDTGLSSPTFFWGRWVRRKQLNFVAVGAPGAGGGAIGGPVGSGHPVVENLLIAFDNDGNVLRWHVVDDDDLLKRMVRMLKGSGASAAVRMPPVPYSCAFFPWDQVTPCFARDLRMIRRNSAVGVHMEPGVAPVVENIAPSVTIVKPSSGSSFVLSKTPTTITIEAAASDPDAPVRIQVKRK